MISKKECIVLTFFVIVIIFLVPLIMSYCGDSICEINESCANCSSDCLLAGQVCCNGINYTGNCCNSSSCSQYYSCINHACTANWTCGDGICNANESCANCSADCMLAGQICCNGINYTGNCCTSSNCSVNQSCINHVCINVSYCGNGVCDANESCANCSADCTGTASQCCSPSSNNSNSAGYIDSGRITTAGHVCCSGTEYTGECCSDAECSSPNVCYPFNRTCIEPYFNKCMPENCLCDLSIGITSDGVFDSNIAESFYIYVLDNLDNYTGTANVEYSIENVEGYISSFSPVNTTITVDQSVSKGYTPSMICDSETQYIDARIVRFGCNDSSSGNNAVTKTISIVGKSCTTTQTPAVTPITQTPTQEVEPVIEEVEYSIEIPEKIEIEEAEKGKGSVQKSIKIGVKVDNNKNVSKEFAIWSYVYSNGVCVSCLDGKTEESNKITIVLNADSSDTIELENIFGVIEGGIYQIKVNILEEGSEVKVFDYSIEVASYVESILGEYTGETKEEKSIYEEKSDKIRMYAIIFFSFLFLGTIAFFGYKNKEDVTKIVDRTVGKSVKFLKEKGIALKKDESKSKKKPIKTIEKRKEIGMENGNKKSIISIIFKIIAITFILLTVLAVAASVYAYYFIPIRTVNLCVSEEMHDLPVNVPCTGDKDCITEVMKLAKTEAVESGLEQQVGGEIASIGFGMAENFGKTISKKTVKCIEGVCKIQGIDNFDEVLSMKGTSECPPEKESRVIKITASKIVPPKLLWNITKTAMMSEKLRNATREFIKTGQFPKVE